MLEKAELPRFFLFVALAFTEEVAECCSELATSHSPLRP